MTPEDRKTLIAVADHLDDIAPGAAHATALRAIASRPLTVSDGKDTRRSLMEDAFDAAWSSSVEGHNSECGYGDDGNNHHGTPDEYLAFRAEKIERIISGSPLTVADLLPLADATHEVRWVTPTTGEQMRYRHDDGCEYLRSPNRGGGWGSAQLYGHDLVQPATLVEVEAWAAFSPRSE